MMGNTTAFGKGSPQTEQHKINAGLSRKGKPAWNKGLTSFKHSEETKKAIGLSRTGKIWNETIKEKISLTEKRTKSNKKLIKQEVQYKENNIC